VSQARGDRNGRARRRHYRPGAACEGAGARGQGTAPGQRNLEAGLRFSCSGGARPPTQVLHIAPSGYRRHAAQRSTLDLRCARARTGDTLKTEIKRVWHKNMLVFGANKIWKEMNGKCMAVARCTVDRLMRIFGLRGVRRNNVVRTTIGDITTSRPLEQVNRQLIATTS
jgi:HTH-like domain